MTPTATNYQVIITRLQPYHRVTSNPLTLEHADRLFEQIRKHGDAMSALLIDMSQPTKPLKRHPNEK